MKKTLIRNGRHMRPMLAVLERNGLGSVDALKDGTSRGRWITEADLPAIRAAIIKEGCSFNDGDALCDGANIHNTVYFRDFVCAVYGTVWNDEQTDRLVESFADKT